MQVDHVGPGDPAEIAAGLAARLTDPVGVFAAPGRVNLIGEHTDYNGGLCLPIALPHATYAAVARRDDDRLTVTSVQQDDRFERRLDDIAPGAVTGWASYVAGVAWALREAGHDLPGMDLVVDGRVPLGAGLSSSAALVCSSALAMTAAAGLDLSPQDLVGPTMRAESEVAGAPTGGLDQTVSLLGTAGHALLIDFADHSTHQVPWSPAHAGLTLLVVDTRSEHALVDGGYASRRADCEAAAHRLGVASLRDVTEEGVDRLDDDRLRRRARHVVTEIGRVQQAVDALAGGDWESVGKVFVASHASMRDDFEISCDELDVVVETAVAAGALGARMTGGGFGGSAIALVPTDDADRIAGRDRGRLRRPGLAGAGRAARARLGRRPPDLRRADRPSPRSGKLAAMTSLADFSARAIDGTETDLASTTDRWCWSSTPRRSAASPAQYAGLQELHDDLRRPRLHGARLPVQPVRRQEPGRRVRDRGRSADRSFGVTFPMFAKVDVNGEDTHPLFAWLKKREVRSLGRRDQLELHQVPRRRRRAAWSAATAPPPSPRTSRPTSRPRSPPERCHHDPVVGSRDDVPLVGRQRELAVLRAAVTRAADGTPGAVLVAGEAGGGKSRLVRALLTDRRRPGPLVLRAQCVDLGDPGLPYLAMVDLVRAVGATRPIPRSPRSSTAFPLVVAPHRPGGLRRRPGRRVAPPPALRRDGGPARRGRPRPRPGRGRDRGPAVGGRLLGRLPPVPAQPDARGTAAGGGDRPHRRAGGAPRVRQLLSELGRLPSVDRLDLEPFDARRWRSTSRGRAATATRTSRPRCSGVRGGTRTTCETLAGGGRAEPAVDEGLPRALADLLVGRLDGLPDDARTVVRCAAGRRAGCPRPAAARGGGT